MTRQTPEESAMAIANSTEALTEFLQEMNPQITKPEAMQTTALLIGLIVDWIKENDELQQEVHQMLEEIANEGN